MTETQSDQNKIEIVRNATNIANIKEDIKDIKLEVTNHLPTQVKTLEDKMMEQIKVLEDKMTENDKEQDKRINALAVKFAGVVAVVSILVQIAFKLF